MSTPENPARDSRSSALLVMHDIRLERRAEADAPRVAALAYCERLGRQVDVEHCARCERFVRIEPHEAGYVMLCRSGDAAELAPCAAEHDPPR